MSSSVSNGLLRASAAAEDDMGVEGVLDDTRPVSSETDTLCN